MGSSTAAESGANDAFLAAFRERSGSGNRLRYSEFVQLALYHPTLGYYQQGRPRVGYGRGTDFYTASTSGAIFGELIVDAVASLLAEHGARPEHTTFVEIGAEPGTGVLRDVPHPFAAARTLRLGDPLKVEGSCVVFSNELFDAQPFDRYVREADGWHEILVELREGRLTETTDRLAETPDWLPADVPTGYHFDAPRQAADLARTIAAQPWSGLFVAFDYGKRWAELAADTPAGTARAYVQHRQSNDLLAQPGAQDLTCHVCWDWLAEALTGHGFTMAPVLPQEAFLVTHASGQLSAIMAAESGHLSQRKLSLMQLLHPAHLGQKFQVLYGWRS